MRQLTPSFNGAAAEQPRNPDGVVIADGGITAALQWGRG